MDIKQQYVKVILFSAFISIIFSVLFLLFRSGLDEKYLTEIFKVLGIAFFIIVTPFILYTIFLHDSGILVSVIGSFFSILLVCLLGYLFTDSLSLLIPSLGYISFIIITIKFLRTSKASDIAFGFMCVLLSTYLFSVIYSSAFFSPIFIEKISSNAFWSLDSLYHISFAQILKNYEIPSTGIDFVPKMNYHFGSHYIFAQISKFTGIPIYLIYQLGYPVIFISFFVYCFLSSVILIKNSFKLSNSSNKSKYWHVLYSLVFLLGFIGFSYNNFNGLANKTASAWNNHILSESYNLSLSFFFLIITLSLTYHKETNKNRFRRTKKAIYAFVYFLLLVSIGLCKISTLFITLISISYLFIRSSEFRKNYKLIYFLSVLVAVIILLSVHDFKAGDGGFSFFHFFKTWIKTDFFIYIFFYWFWLISASLIVIFLNGMKNLSTKIKKKEFIYIELLLVIAIVGITPGLVLEISGSSAIYFSDIQNWVALLLIMVLFSEFVKKVKFRSKKVIAITIFFCGYSIVVIFNNINYKTKQLINNNISIRNSILNNHPDSKLRREVINNLTQGNFNKTVSLVKSISTPVQDSLNKNKRYQIIKFLLFLDQEIIDKSSIIIKLKDMIEITSFLDCTQFPFIIPAFSGIATSGVLRLENCPAQGYGFEYYPIDTIEKETFLRNIEFILFLDLKRLRYYKAKL